MPVPQGESRGTIGKAVTAVNHSPLVSEYFDLDGQIRKIMSRQSEIISQLNREDQEQRVRLGEVDTTPHEPMDFFTGIVQ